jgi:WD40-like Beta Propeller Repeat
MRLGAAVAVGILGVVFGAAGAPSAHAASTGTRILYAGDWTGPMQIFAADPTGRSPVRQVTFVRPRGSCYSTTACGVTRPLPSPDGRRLAYWTKGPRDFEGTPTLWLARPDGGASHSIGPAFDAAWAPDSRRFAYAAADGLHVRTPGGRDRIVDRRQVGAVRYSPDGRTIAFAGGGGLTLLRGGRERVLVRTSPSAFAWSADGRAIAYGTPEGIFLVSTGTGRSRPLYRPQGKEPIFGRLELAFAPKSRLLAFTYGGAIRFMDTRTLRLRTMDVGGRNIDWSPDGQSLLFLPGAESAAGDSISTGDVQTVTLGGRVRTVVAAAKPYGGQIIAAAWARSAHGLHYRPPQRVDGTFAGGPVQELVADGGRVGFISCGGVSVWTEATGAVDAVARAPDCRASYSRGHVYSLGLAGDRVAWWEKGWGLCFTWQAHEATLGGPTLEFGSGYGCLGSAPVEGSGTAVGSGSLLVFSAWKLRSGGLPPGVDLQTIERLQPGGCPCPALSSSPGPYTPLDVDGGRIVVSGHNETRILAADGTILLSLPVPTLAAQLDGSDLVLAAGSELRLYDAASGALRATWSLPAQPAGHNCDFYGDPSCGRPGPLVLEDVGRGLAVYVLDGEVHLLRLRDGADRVVAAGTLARFMDAGLVYADGARIRMTPFARLPLR